MNEDQPDEASRGLRSDQNVAVADFRLGDDQEPNGVSVVGEGWLYLRRKVDFGLFDFLEEVLSLEESNHRGAIKNPLDLNHQQGDQRELLQKLLHHELPQNHLSVNKVRPLNPAPFFHQNREGNHRQEVRREHYGKKDVLQAEVVIHSLFILVGVSDE